LALVDSDPVGVAAKRLPNGPGMWAGDIIFEYVKYEPTRAVLGARQGQVWDPHHDLIAPGEIRSRRRPRGCQTVQARDVGRRYLNIIMSSMGRADYPTSRDYKR
jgi:hypothetical protein